MEEQKFISLLNDLTFKTLWISKNKKAREYMNRTISYIVGYDVSEFELSTNELAEDNYKSIANRVDILLVNKNKMIKINVELNRNNKKTLVNKNDSYIYKIAGEFYAGIDKKYFDDINVEQVNLNNFPNKLSEEVIFAHYEMIDPINKVTKKGIKIHDVYLPKIKSICYDECEEIYKDLAMFSTSNYEEMSKTAKGNELRETIMEELKKLGSDREYVDYYNHEEFEAALRQEYKEEGYEEGYDRGYDKCQKELIGKLSKSMSKEEISKLINLSIEEINNILEK